MAGLNSRGGIDPRIGWLQSLCLRTKHSLPKEKILGVELTSWRGVSRESPWEGGRLDFMLSGDASKWDFCVCMCEYVGG